MMSMNNLGGNFVSTPLVADEKGYKVTSFGQPQIGFSCIPCYDEKNNRMLTIVFYQSGDVMSTPWGGNFPVGTQYQLSKLVPAKITPGGKTCIRSINKNNARSIYGRYVSGVAIPGWS